MPKITLVGITHIDTESQKKVERIITSLRPDAVCLELDKHRLEILIENESAKVEQVSEIDIKDSKTDTDTTASIVENSDSNEDGQEKYDNTDLVSILDDIGFFESELARITKTELPGREMYIAYQKALEINADIYLIDQSIHEISSIMEQEVSVEEGQKFQEIVDELVFDKKIVSNPIDFLMDENEEEIDHQKQIENIEESEEINLDEVFKIFKNENALDNILSEFKTSFPKLFSILLEDRNVYMAKKIIEVAERHSNIVVVLGYGHIKEIREILTTQNEKIEVEVAE